MPFLPDPQRPHKRSHDAAAHQDDDKIDRLGLYPRPAAPIFERGLHFLARFPIERDE
jgi:hypothetical protein